MFRNRYEAGLQIARALESLALDDPCVLAIPRGGIEVGCPVARSLNRRLDVIIPRKVSDPEEPELAIGAVTFDGGVEINRGVVEKLQLSQADLDQLIRPALAEIDRRMRLYRGDLPTPALTGRDVVIVDDGLATGYTMAAAIRLVQRERPRRVIVAVPVSPASTFERLRPSVDELIVLHLADEGFFAVSSFYENFRDSTDEELVQLLTDNRSAVSRSAQSKG